MVLVNPNDLPTSPLGDLTQFSLLVCRGLIEGRNPDFPTQGRVQRKLDFSVGKKGDFSGAFFVQPRVGRKAPLICEAGFASLKEPLRPAREPIDSTDAREDLEASGRRRSLQYDSRRTNVRPARSSL
jgi:hypothetical protein